MWKIVKLRTNKRKASLQASQVGLPLQTLTRRKLELLSIPEPQVSQTESNLLVLIVKNLQFLAMDVEKIIPGLKMVCVATNGVFVGAAFYVLSVEFPSMDEHSYGCVLKILRLKHTYHHRMQSGLAIISGLSGVALYFMDKEKNLPFLMAGSIMLSTFPFTGLAIAPQVKPLINPSAKDEMEEMEVRNNVNKLRRLLSVRCLASLTAFGYLLYHLTN